MRYRLWFDVERTYLATFVGQIETGAELWFDVERTYLATSRSWFKSYYKLWFDVERTYLATSTMQSQLVKSCGLM